MRRSLVLFLLLALTAPAFAAFTTTAAKVYSMSQRSVVRVWTFGGATSGTTTGLYVNTPTSIYVECWGSSFDSGTVTVEYSATNGSFAALATQSITFTAAGTALVASADVKTGYYAMVLSGAAGTASNITCYMQASGAVDVF